MTIPRKHGCNPWAASVRWPLTALLATTLLAATAKASLSTISQEASQKAATGHLPALPHGAPTVIGGIIEKRDPVRDRFTLKIYGGKTMQVLYDPRTAVFRDGVRQSLFSLQSQEPASVETVLDGTAVFAVSIHTLSHLQAGDCQGQIISAAPSLGEITVRCGLNPDTTEFHLAPDATIERIRPVQGAAAVPASAQDLVAGALVSVHFVPSGSGHATASSIHLLASPGMPFLFAGRLTFLDLAAGRMTIATSSGQSYALGFPPRNFPAAEQLKVVDLVRVTANFDGSGYTALRVESD